MSTDEEYKREVLEPARAAGDQPPEDLRVRYRLREPLLPGEVTAQVKAVRQCWRRARGQLKYRKLIDRLEAEHRQLTPLFTAAERGDLRPLQERLRSGHARTELRRTEARARLADAAGALRMVAPAELEDLARTGGLTRAELESLAAGDQIETREPDALPVTAPYAGYRKVRESLDVLGHRHLAAFLYAGHRIGPIGVFGGFGAPGAEPLPEAIGRTTTEWARRTRDTSSTHADTVLVALRAGRPDELILYDVVERLRERYRLRASDRTLLRHAVEELGIALEDARRLVFAVLRESGPAGGAAGRLRSLLDAGDVYAAAGYAEALPADAGEEAELLATEARRRLDEALRLRETAVAEKDPDRAWRLLADALRLVRDLPGAAEHQRRLPPRPVSWVRAEPDGGTIRLAWGDSPSTAGEITYQAVRCPGRPPRHAGDGVQLPGPRDDRPPVNVPLYYGVIARRGEAAANPAVTGPVVLRPEPQAVELSTGDGVVTGRWRCPPEAAGVLVVRGAVRSDALGETRRETRVLAERESFTERVANGTTHHYRIAAVYLDDKGREVVTPGVRVSATPTAPPEPVRTLTAEPDPVDPARVLLRFTPPANGTAEIVLLDEPPPWRPGTLVRTADLHRAGRRVPATPAAHGLAVRPGGSGWLLVATLAGDTAAVGAHHRHVNLPPPPALAVDRHGETVRIGFDWPPDVAEMELRYRIGDGETVTETVSRARYEAESGIRLPAPETERVELSIAATGTRQGTRVTGPAVTETLAARAVVHYDLERTGPRRRRSLTIRLKATRPVRIGRLVLVRRPGQVMPDSAGGGETLGSWTQVPVPGEISLPLPKDSGPYWLRCFAEDDVIELVDPPVRRLHTPR